MKNIILIQTGQIESTDRAREGRRCTPSAQRRLLARLIERVSDWLLKGGWLSIDSFGQLVIVGEHPTQVARNTWWLITASHHTRPLKAFIDWKKYSWNPIYFAFFSEHAVFWINLRNDIWSGNENKWNESSPKLFISMWKQKLLKSVETLVPVASSEFSIYRSLILIITINTYSTISNNTIKAMWFEVLSHQVSLSDKFVWYANRCEDQGFYRCFSINISTSFLIQGRNDELSSGELFQIVQICKMQ